MQRIQNYGKKALAFFEKKVLARLHPTARVPMAIAAGIVALCLVLCIISGLHAASMRKTVNGAETKLRRSLQTELNLLIRSEEKSTMDKYDLNGEILPEMRKYIYSVNLLNTQIGTVFGKEHQPIESGLISSFNSALDTLQDTLTLKNDPAKTLKLLEDYLSKMQMSLQ